MMRTTRVRLDRIASSTRNAQLAREVFVSEPIIAAEGYVLAVRILDDKPTYNTIEDLSGRMVPLKQFASFVEEQEFPLVWRRDRVPTLTVRADVLPGVLPGFLKAHPRVNVSMQERQNPEIALGVLDGSADVGIVSARADTPGLRGIHFATDRLVLLVPRSHRFARRKSIRFAQALDEDFVGMHPGSTLSEFLATVTAGAGKPLRLRVELSNFDAVDRKSVV